MYSRRRYYIAIGATVATIILLIIGGIICASEMTRHYNERTLINQKTLIDKFLRMLFIVILGASLLLLWTIHLILARWRTDKTLHIHDEDTKKHVQIAHVQRLQEMGALSAELAHEINNLMTPIMANSLLLLETIPPEDTETYDSLLEIYNASERAKGIVSKISILSRKDDDTPQEPIRLDEFLRKACEYSKLMPAENIHVVLKPGCGNSKIMGREISLLQVFMNLFTNACYAMKDKGGTLTVTSSITEDQKWAEIRVSDTGGGISEKNMEHIFEAFYTTKPAGKGTGLGLSIVCDIVKEHRGTITARNWGKGAEFTICFPLL